MAILGSNNGKYINLPLIDLLAWLSLFRLNPLKLLDLFKKQSVWYINKIKLIILSHIIVNESDSIKSNLAKTDSRKKEDIIR